MALSSASLHKYDEAAAVTEPLAILCQPITCLLLWCFVFVSGDANVEMALSCDSESMSLCQCDVYPEIFMRNLTTKIRLVNCSE